MNKLFLISTMFLLINLHAQKDCQIQSKNFPPITDLGSSIYRGFSGGLYNNGSNQLSGSYLNDALTFTTQIKPLDNNGNASNSGKIVMVGVGASNPRTEFAALQRQYDSFSNKNAKLILANTCIGGQGVQKMNNAMDNYWVQAQKTFDSMGIDFNQVQIAWVETDNTQDGDTMFPRAPLNLISDLKQLMITMKLKFPNLKLCYFSARAYAGWASGGVGKGLSHPRDYYNGWAIKWMIDSAANQNPNYNYKGSQAQIPMPLYATYNWTNAEQVRQDGFSVNCATDIGNDGLHLSAMGESKIGNLMFNFFKNDASSKSWFNKSNGMGVDKTKTNLYLGIYPNPSQNGFNIENGNSERLEFTIYNSLGSVIHSGEIDENNFIKINTDFWNKGFYFYRDNLGHYIKIILE